MWPDLIASLAALLVALATLWKVLAEVAKLRQDLADARRLAQSTNNQLRPDSGSSARDAIDRIEQNQQATQAALGRIADHLAHLNEVDLADRTQADTIHRHITDRLARLERRPWRTPPQKG